MSITNLRFEIAKKDYECNACLFVKDSLEELIEGLDDEQKSVIELAKSHNWQVLKGERCRRYTWGKGTEEVSYNIEIPAIAEIVSYLDLWRD